MSLILYYFLFFFFFFFQAEDGIRDAQESRGLGDVYKRQLLLLLVLSMLAVAGVYTVLLSPVSRKLALWLALNCIGFGYVSRVTERRPWFLSRFGNFWEIGKVMALAPLIFPLGPMWTICGSAITIREYAIFNVMYYVFPFFIGLNWTHFQRWKPLRGISLSPAGIKQLMTSSTACIVVAAALPGVVGAIVYHIWLIHKSTYSWLFLGYVCVLVLGIGVTSFAVRRTHEVHLHHFFTTCVLIPLTSFHTPVSAVCQSLLAGIYIEGSARFGMGYFVDQWSQRDLGYRTEWGWCCIPLH
eukprot:TRINITY_DN3222_c0_g1_i5.p1 TRINITY_DN3222_c0_g1~~TRINITY_DN3222_c0_g1_i5.p1  ORF type:complete len:298 (+),score=67.12 TRINITY_DN3222_c0_g1_i5:81-974(+)